MEDCKQIWAQRKLLPRREGWCALRSRLRVLSVLRLFTIFTKQDREQPLAWQEFASYSWSWNEETALTWTLVDQCEEIRDKRKADQIRQERTALFRANES